MKIIASPLDFIGLNIYQPTYVRADESPSGYAVVTPPRSFPHMYSPWLYVGPEAIYWATRAGQPAMESEGTVHHGEWRFLIRCAGRPMG